MKLKFKKTLTAAITPTRAHPSDAGLDLYATNHSVLHVNDIVVFDTGIAMEIPEGYVGLVFPRSSIVKTNLRLSNSVGVIDSSYRGSISVVFDKINSDAIDYRQGDRIAQLVIMPIVTPELEEVNELTSTSRGTGGYGSTGS